MPEICQFEVHKADATLKNGSMTARLFYSKNPKVNYKRSGGNLDFGIGVFRSLLSEGYSEIANSKNMMVSPSSGLVYLLSDGYLVLHRRDRMAPVHKLYQSLPAGFTQSVEDTQTLDGLIRTGLKENTEECLLITRDKIPKLVIPEGSKKYILETAKNLKLDLEPMEISSEIQGFNDKLEVYDHTDKLLFSGKGLIEWSYESQTVINFLQVRKLPLRHDEIYPLDCEGSLNEGDFVHFDRESYLLDLKEISGKKFGDELENPLVFKTKIEGGVPKTYKPTYERPYLGPNATVSDSPHIWAPDNLLVRVLDGLGVKGYKGRWMQIELEKEIRKNKEL